MATSQILYVGLASFAPSTAFEAVTDFPAWATIIITGVVGTFYTTIGGMKAVVWTDVFQALVMVAGMLAIVIQGAVSVGGMERVWELNEKWSRIKFFNFDPNPTTRHTVWGLVVGSALNWLGAYGIGQASVQRYSSLPTLTSARKSLLLNMVGLIFFITLACVSGIVLFAYYADKDCDPLGLKLVDTANQLIPYFVMETLAYPGVPGLFIACLFSGALSSVSSSLSALAAITWEDILKPRFDTEWSEYKKTVCAKILVIIYGCLGIGMGFIALKLEGTVLQAAVSFLGALGGPLTGMFVLGAFFPWANKYGVIIGAVFGFGISMWLSVGAYVHGISSPNLPYPNGSCFYDGNASLVTVATTMSSMTTMLIDTSTVTTQYGGGSVLDNFYRISYLWYTPIGITTVVVVGLIFSFITGANSINDVPTKYQIPLFTRLFCCLPDSLLYKLNYSRHFQSPKDIRSDEKDADMIVKPPIIETSLPGEKFGVINKAYDDVRGGDIRDSQVWKEYILRTFSNSAQGQNQGQNYLHSNGTVSKVSYC